MKVYFVASETGKKHYLTHYEKIGEVLRENKCELTKTREERVKVHKDVVQWIRSTDCMIVEASFPSISMGYEISLAINNHKPVLLLYTEGEPPSLLDNSQAGEVVCERYSLESIREVVEGFLDYMRNREERRFTFYITSAIMTHLDEVSRVKKLPKAVYLRQLIEADMNK